MAETEQDRHEVTDNDSHLGENTSEGAAARVDAAMRAAMSSVANTTFDINALPVKLEDEAAQELLDVADLSLKDLILKALAFNKEDSDDFLDAVGIPFMAFRNSVADGTVKKNQVEEVLGFSV